MYVKSISYSLPENYETVDSVSSEYDITEMEARIFKSIYGLNRLSLDKNISVERLLLDATSKCLLNANIDRTKIQFLIHAHTGNYILPYGKSAVRNLKYKLGLCNATAIGTNLSKCGSSFVALQIAKQLFSLYNEPIYILLLNGDVSFTKILQMIPGTTITTDGASAILLTKNLDDANGSKILNVATIINGMFAGGIWDNKDIQQIFEKNYANNLSKAIYQCLENTEISLGKISMILPHNVNIISWKRVSKLLNFDIEKIFLQNVSRTGHCFGTDPFMNLCDSLQFGLVKKGDYVLLVTAGLGATFSAMLMQV